jgi:uncharacterized glyoxalase superfamily protein PhnB
VDDANAKKSSVRVTSTAPVLLVPDVSYAAAYYCVVLGFQVEFVQHEGYVAVYRDGVHVHLAAANGVELRSNRVAWSNSNHPADVNFFVDDVDALCAEFTAKGADIDEPPTNQKYGVRDFQVKDCNGYLLRFNQIL